MVAPRLGSSHRRLLADGASDAAWSADGRRIAFIRAGVIRVTGPGLGRSTPLIGRGVGPRLGATGHLSWSPDGTRIAFLRRLRDAVCGEVGVASIPVRGGRIRTLYRPRRGSCARAADVAWSPKGRQVLVATGDLVAMPPNGGRVRTLRESVTLRKTISHVLWLPNGRSFAYVAVGERGFEVSVGRVDGSGDRVLATLPRRFGISALRWWP